MKIRIAGCNVILPPLFALMVTTGVAVACYGFIFSTSSVTACTGEPCTIKTYEPADEYCSSDTSNMTGQSCVYEGEYNVVEKHYVDGLCVNEHCTGGTYDSSQTKTNTIKKPKLIDAHCS
jgi:hypothetical protein